MPRSKIRSGTIQTNI